MKPAIIGTLVGLAIAIAAVTSCSIEHRSDQYACTFNTDCQGGRICSEGFCVVGGTPVDAPRPPTDGRPSDGGSNSNCPGQCTSCNVNQKSCTIDCTKTSCTNTVTCPAGYNCDILCNTENSCRNGVNCQQSASCNVECSAKQACQNVVCGSGPCDVTCNGVQSCRGVSCGSSCACDVTCTGNQSCGEGIVCTSFGCRSGLGCTSMGLFCNSCM